MSSSYPLSSSTRIRPFDIWRCTLYVSVDAAFFVPTSGGMAQLPLTIPNDGSLVGLNFFNQALVLDPGVNPSVGS